MKKLAFFLAALMLLTMTAWAAPAGNLDLHVGDDPIVGDWHVVAMVMDGEEYRLDEIFMEYMSELPLMLMTTTAQGTFAVSIEGRTLVEGVWERKGEAYVFTAEDFPVDASLEENGSVLILHSDDGDKIKFARYEGAGSLIRELDPIVGDWRLVSYTEYGERVDLAEARQYCEPFVVKGDGTFEMGQGDDFFKGTWQKFGDVYMLYDEDGYGLVRATMSADRTQLTLDDHDDMLLGYEKRGA